MHVKVPNKRRRSWNFSGARGRPGALWGSVVQLECGKKASSSGYKGRGHSPDVAPLTSGFERSGLDDHLVFLFQVLNGPHLA